MNPQDDDLAPLISRAPWLLGFSGKNSQPALNVLRRRQVQGKSVLQNSGRLVGEQQCRCLPILRRIVGQVQDGKQVSLELWRYLPATGIVFRGKLPLDEEAGSKLTLIFQLACQPLDRMELVARRVERFTREEAAYWLSRITDFGDKANRWARAGLTILLAGQRGTDPGVQQMLEQLRDL
jgi:hypothetical protein